MSMVADGWVEEQEVAGGGIKLYVELFANAILDLNLKQGDYVRLMVLGRETLLRLGHDDGQI